MYNPYSVTIVQLNRRGTWVAKSYVSCDDLESAKARIDTETAFYHSRGYGIAYRVTHRNAEVLSGESQPSRPAATRSPR
jgi:hypothetical protein